MGPDREPSQRGRPVRASRSLRLLGDSEPPPYILRRSLVERCSFGSPDEPGGPLACAVSGGADSIALLLLAAEAGQRPVAYHVDHRLRPGSGDELEIVRQAARLVDADVVSLAVDVGEGPNLEARARAARLEVLPPGTATGHTADDQAETVLINLLRGSAAAGLAGMSPGRRHPLLAVRRAETEALCREAGLEWFEDPSNSDRRYLRNRIRHDLLPTLCDLAGRDLVPILCRQSALLADDERLFDELSVAIDPTAARSLNAAPPPLARRAVRRWLREVGGTGLPPSGAAVERVLGVAAGRALACDVGGGISVRRRQGRLVIEQRQEIAGFPGIG